jgi:hypothetical protein
LRRHIGSFKLLRKPAIEVLFKGDDLERLKGIVDFEIFPGGFGARRSQGRPRQG